MLHLFAFLIILNTEYVERDKTAKFGSKHIITQQPNEPMRNNALTCAVSCVLVAM